MFCLCPRIHKQVVIIHHRKCLQLIRQLSQISHLTRNTSLWHRSRTWGCRVVLLLHTHTHTHTHARTHACTHTYTHTYTCSHTHTHTHTHMHTHIHTHTHTHIHTHSHTCTHIISNSVSVFKHLYVFYLTALILKQYLPTEELLTIQTHCIYKFKVDKKMMRNESATIYISAKCVL